ncbi:MAG: Gfo/Idh/MocA family oxidoreductase [Verrucomicrobia subdivision 3 bacterium]|nr:Gfo/Idh/MocA family oxidoreductase [Limisphaerales bacterium]
MNSFSNSAVTRRQFLHDSAALAVAVAGASAVAQLPARRRIRLGFLGASHSHASGKLKLAAVSSDFELVGVAEESPAVRQRLQNVNFVSEKELFERAEAIAVESDVRDHARHALSALRAGKHVHVEKPPSANLRDMQELIAAARDKRLLLQTGYMWRYHPGFQRIFEAARRGWLGDIFMIRAAMTNSLEAERRAEWAEFKGGSFFELGCHLLDPIVRLLGKPIRITSHLRRHGPFADSFKDNNVVTLEFDRALAVITNSSLQPNSGSHRAFEVLGTNGTAVLRPIEPPVLHIDLLKPAGPYKAGAQKVESGGYRRYEGDLAEFAAAIRGEKLLTASLDQELQVQEVLLEVCGM